MFTINLGDGREAPSKARKNGAKHLEFLVYKIALIIFNRKIFVGEIVNSENLTNRNEEILVKARQLFYKSGKYCN